MNPRAEIIELLCTSDLSPGFGAALLVEAGRFPDGELAKALEEVRKDCANLKQNQAAAGRKVFTISEAAGWTLLALAGRLRAQRR